MDQCPEVNLLDADCVCESLGLGPAPEIWRETWAQSEGSFRAHGADFVSTPSCEKACETLRMGQDTVQAIIAGAAQIEADAALQRLTWHLHWLLLHSGLDPQVSQWSAIPPGLPVGLRMVYAVVLVAGLPQTLKVNGVRGIPEQVTIETFADVEIWVREQTRRDGVPGIGQIGWLSHHARGNLFWLGRLQYLPGRYHHPFRFYRNSSTGAVVALVDDGLLLREDGQFADADRGAVRDGLWLSRLDVTADEVCGNPVSPWGHVLRERTTLDGAQWYEVLRAGDPVMTVHIPASGPMDQESCGESFRQAIDFFAGHFPDMPFRAFTCSSWLLDPQFEQMDPPPGNICAFLRNWYLHPIQRASDGQSWERAFDVHGNKPSLEDAPQDTSLQRAMIAFMKNGGRCRGGGSVLFAEDLDWGNEVYRGR